MGTLGSTGIVVSPVLALQLAQALLTACVLWVFQRRFGYPALAYWTYGWLALAAELCLVAAYPPLVGPRPATDLPAIAVTAIVLAGEYFKAAWLMLGAFAIADSRDRYVRRGRWIAVAIVVVVLATVLPFATTSGADAPRFLLRAGTMAGITAVARIVAGVLLWARTLAAFARRNDRWGARENAPALGQRLVAAAFVLLGGVNLYGFWQHRDDALEALPRLLPFADEAQLLLNFMLGLGLVIWLLEGEQRRTLEAAQRAEHMAYHDPLTGLPNRLLLIDRLRLLVAQSRRAGQPFAVFFLDVDHFKSINDEHGHAAGDRLLQQIAARLSAQLREADTVARLGGDEFVILTPDLRTPGDVAAIGAKLCDAIRGPIALDDVDVRVTVSVGVSVFPEDGDDADILLRRSDQALYRAKEAGRDAVRLA